MFIHVTFKQAIGSTSKLIEILSVAAIVGDVDGYPMFAGLATGVGIGDEQPRLSTADDHNWTRRRKLERGVLAAAPTPIHTEKS